MSTIKVAVRVRPLSEVEISRNCAVVVKAENSQVTVTNPESERSKTFTFDDVVSCVINIVSFCRLIINCSLSLLTYRSTFVQFSYCGSEDEQFNSQKQVIKCFYCHFVITYK